MDDFSLARPAGHLIMGDGSGPDGLATKDGAKALSGAASVDTATTQVDKPSRTKNLITEYNILVHGFRNRQADCEDDAVGICAGLWNFALSYSMVRTKIRRR